MEKIVIKKGASFSMKITIPAYPVEARPYTVAAQLKKTAVAEESILDFAVLQETSTTGIAFTLSLTPKQTRTIPTPQQNNPTDLVPFVADILVMDVNGGVLPAWQGVIYVNPVVSSFGV